VSERRKKLASSPGARRAVERHEERGKRFAFLKERLARIDLEEMWEQLEENLTLGDGRKNPEKVSRAIDEVDSFCRKAGMIAHAAVEELDEFDIHWRSAYAEWERHARETLEKRKKEKRLSGQITNDQVENWIARNIEDYSRWKEARRSLDRSKALAKQMADAWQSRAASLRKQADLFMSRRGVDPNMLPRRGRGGRGDNDGEE
jgi:hypothetical protein